MIGDCEFGPQSSHVLTFLAFPETKWRKKNYLRSRNLFPKYFMGLGSQIPLQMSHIYFYTRGMCFLSHPYLQVCSRVAIERSFHCTVLSRGETFRLIRTNGESCTLLVLVWGAPHFFVACTQWKQQRGISIGFRLGWFSPIRIGLESVDWIWNSNGVLLLQL